MRDQLDSIDDVARFGVSDPTTVVWASLMCGVCLHQPHLVAITGSPDGRVAVASCGHCPATTRVALSDEQVHRLWTIPRGRTFVHFPAALW